MGCGQREAGGPRRRLAYLEAHLNSPRSVRSTAGSTAEPRPSRRQSRAQAHRYAIDARSRRPTRPKPPRRESNRWTRDREAATRQHTARDTAEKATTKTKTRAGRPLNKSALPAEPRPRRPRHLADARAVAADLQRAARVGGRLGRVAHARPSDRRREPERRGGTTREGRLLTRSDAR